MAYLKAVQNYLCKCLQFIHTLHNNHYIPLVFCLLPDKRKETFTRKCFNYCTKNARKLIWTYHSE